MINSGTHIGNSKYIIIDGKEEFNLYIQYIRAFPYINPKDVIDIYQEVIAQIFEQIEISIEMALSRQLNLMRLPIGTIEEDNPLVEAITSFKADAAVHILVKLNRHHLLETGFLKNYFLEEAHPKIGYVLNNQLVISPRTARGF